MKLGEKIKLLRTQRHLSQEALAHMLGVSRQAVTKWESGAAMPSTANLLSLCDALGVSMNELTDNGQNTPQIPTAAKHPLLCGIMIGFSAAFTVLCVFAWVMHQAFALPDDVIGAADAPTGILVTGAPTLLYILTAATALLIVATVLILILQNRRKRS